MPIDFQKLLSAPPVRTTVSWDDCDVRLYHLGLGAGVPETDPTELRYVYERHAQGLQVLLLFGVVAAGVGFQVFDLPGVDIALTKVLHGGQDVTVHRPLPAVAKATAVARVTDVYDKGKAAVLVQESTLLGEDEQPLLTQRNQIFVHGEGGFGGDRGPSGRVPDPDREPDQLIELPTLPQQALLYRLNGDWNPLHADPAVARRLRPAHPARTVHLRDGRQSGHRPLPGRRYERNRRLPHPLRGSVLPGRNPADQSLVRSRHPRLFAAGHRGAPPSASRAGTTRRGRTR